MATGSSTVKVNIVGDATSLQSAVKTSEKSIKSFGGTAAKVGAGIAAAFVASEVVDFTQTALNEADRIGDAFTRLNATVGEDTAKAIDEASGGLERLGQSRQDVLELAASFADTATALQLANPEIAKFAPEAAETAAALALITDNDAATNIDLIGKAAGGGIKALKELGISLTDDEVAARAMADTGKTSAAALTEQDKAAAAYQIVLEKLNPKIQAVTESSGDYEQKSAALQAKFETLTGKIGEGVEGPLSDLLDWVLKGIAGWEYLAAVLDVNNQKFAATRKRVQELLTPLARLVDLLNIAGEGLGQLINPLGRLTGGKSETNVTVQGGDPNEVQRAIEKALGDIKRTNDRPLPF